jgi:pimeloyl-ACP methyl ester carboxylesterase
LSPRLLAPHTSPAPNHCAWSEPYDQTSEDERAIPRIMVNDINIYHQVTGRGYPLTFIHGANFESSTWDPQVRYFAKKHRAITYAIRAHGQSELPEKAHPIADCVEDLRQLLRHLSVERTSLTRLSIGGNIALSFTLAHPEMVDAIILAGINSRAVHEDARSAAGRSRAMIWANGIEVLLPTYRTISYSLSLREGHPDYIASWEGLARRKEVNRWRDLRRIEGGLYHFDTINSSEND